MKWCPSADAVAALVPRDATVVCAGLPMGPQALLRAICRRLPELGSPTIYCGDLSGEFSFLDDIPQEAWGRLRLLVGGGPVPRTPRARVDLHPWSVHETELQIASGLFKVDACLVTVAPGDHGRFCLSPQVACLPSAMARAPLVLAEVYENLPVLLGDVDLGPEDIDAALVVQGDLPGFEPGPAPDATARAIAARVAELVPDDACLQLGIGALAEAILAALDGHRNLSAHAGFIGDGIARLMRRGVINGESNPLARGKTVAGALLGGRALIDFADRNPDILLRAFSHTNDPAVIASIPRFFAINSALCIDLLGQAGAEATDGVLRAGGGGQMDFMTGAHRSPGGASVIALPSTAAAGAVSRIVPPSRLGGPATCHRSWVDFVVTEHGIADLRGASVRERAARLVAVTDPSHREALAAAAARILP